MAEILSYPKLKTYGSITHDPEIQLRTFVETLFDRPPPSDNDLMYQTIMSLKDKIDSIVKPIFETI